MRIAYIGPNWGTSQHRANALRRLGHEVHVIDPLDYLSHSRWATRWLHHTGALGVSFVIDEPIFRNVCECRPELVWVNQGEFLGPELLQRLRTLSAPIVNYTNDDPFNGRDSVRFRPYLKALPYYDLVVVMRESNIKEALHHGARRVLRVFMSADEVAHAPPQLTSDERRLYASDVAFVGTWMPERGPFLRELIRLDVPISIWGDRWHRAREWQALKPYWRGPAVYDDRYAKIIGSAKVVLGLLSKRNRDLHTTRSMEIPALGSLLCAERTSEHMALYDYGVEAVFWTTPEECATACRHLLADEPYRQTVVRRGRERLQQNGHYNESVLDAILKEATKETVDSAQ